MKQFLSNFWQAQKTIWLFLGTRKRPYVFYNSLIFIIFFYDLVPAFIFGQIVDFFTHYEKGQSLLPFYLLGIILSVSWTFVSILRLTCKNKLSNISIVARSNARVMSINNLLNLSAEYHSSRNSGNSLQQIFTGSQAINDIIKLMYRNIWSIFASFLGIITVFIFLSPPLLIFMAAYSTIFFIIEFYFNGVLTRLSKSENLSLEKSSGSIVETTGNILAVKSLGFEKEIYEHLSRKEEVIKKIQLEKSNIKNLKWKFFQVLNGLSLGIFVFLIGRGVINGLITVGSILVFYSYYNKLREATQATTDAITDFIEYSTSLSRLKEIFESDKITIRDGVLFPSDWQFIKFNNVDFSYPTNDRGLSGLNLKINKGEILGVVGSSGSGKSTLAKLLVDLYQPSSGEIMVNDLPYSKISHSDLLESISVVPQEVELFNLSIVENISIMRSINKELLQKVIVISELDEVIKKLPQGINTLIGEKGYALSGGERQRVGIARALYKNAEIIIFDEATSMLDGKTEKKIIGNVLKAFSGQKTFVFVAHRLAALDAADRIIVFKEGKLVEEGSYVELKDKGGLFAKLFESQIKNS
ncbi:MAG: ABC transporter ATP-binding protein [Patescibacteria group bacterium]